MTPRYLTLVANKMADQLSKLATSDEHTVGEVKDTITIIYKDLLFLASRYEDRFKIRNEYSVSRFLFGIHDDPNEVRCPRQDCQTWNEPLYNFCRECGEDLSALKKRKYWVCPKCPDSPDPYQYSENDKRCVQCGTVLIKDALHTRENQDISKINYYEPKEGDKKSQVP